MACLIYYGTRDKVSSALVTVGSYIGSLFSDDVSAKKITYTYGENGRTGKLENVTGNKHVAAAWGVVDIAAVAPLGRSLAPLAESGSGLLLAKTTGGKSTTVDVLKDVVHANSKASTLENTLYRLETTSGEYLKTGITSKAIPEKRYKNKFMQDKKMTPLSTGSRADMLKKERSIVEQNPGPLNLEPWAGSKRMTF